jgi:hypothetical protein
MRKTKNLLDLAREIGDSNYFTIFDEKGGGEAIYQTFDLALEVRASKRIKFNKEFYIYHGPKDMVV